MKNLPGPGWATLCLCNDGQHAVMGNFFNGQIGKFELASGQMIAMLKLKLSDQWQALQSFHN